MDFEALRETGPDIIGWLNLPDTAINYPVTQADDNEYYLRHLYDGTYNKTGCLFADYENQEDFSDRNTIIYGLSLIHISSADNRRRRRGELFQL